MFLKNKSLGHILNSGFKIHWSEAVNCENLKLVSFTFVHFCTHQNSAKRKYKDIKIGKAMLWTKLNLTQGNVWMFVREVQIVKVMVH